MKRTISLSFKGLIWLNMQWINTRSEVSGLELAFTHLAVIYMRPSKENTFKFVMPAQRLA